MVLTYGEGLYGNGAGVVTPLDHRMAQITGFTKTTTPNLIRPGLLYNGTTTIVSGTSGMSYDVAPFSAVSTRGATQGALPFANDAVANVVTTAAPGSNSRYDVVYAWPRDYAIDGVDSDPVLGVEQGTAAASPTVPSLAAYPGAIELARILVPAGVTGTNSGTTITQTAPFTSADGGTVPFRTTTEMDLWTTALSGQLAFDLSTLNTYQWNGTAWGGLSIAAGFALTGAQSISNGGSANLLQTFTGKQFDTVGFTLASGVFTAQIAGRYRFSMYCAGANQSSGQYGYLDITENGGTTEGVDLFRTMMGGGSNSAAFMGGSMTKTLQLAAGDEVRFFLRQVSGAANTMNYGVEGEHIGPALPVT